MKRLFRKCYIVTESRTNKKTAKSGKVIINSKFLKAYIGKRIKVYVYLVGDEKD